MFFRKLFVGVLLVSSFIVSAYSANIGLYNLHLDDKSYIFNKNESKDIISRLKLALLFSKMSNYAYQNILTPVDTLFLQSNGFNSFRYFSIKDTAGWKFEKQIQVNGVNKKLVVLSFRGTRTDTVFNQIDDILGDVSGVPVEFYDNHTLDVHYGFHKYFKDFRLKESAYIDLSNNNTVYVTVGHSLGGAIAKLYAASLRERGVTYDKISTYTFGAPPVAYTKSDFQKRYNYESGEKPFRIIESTNKLDPIFHIEGLQFPFLGSLKRIENADLNFKKNGKIGYIYPGCDSRPKVLQLDYYLIEIKKEEKSVQ